MSNSSQLVASDESVRCAEFTRMGRVDPGGTAISTDCLIVVELALPWPKPVFAHDLLAGVPDLVREASISCRVLAAVPRVPASGFSVVVYRRGRAGEEPSRSEWHTEASALSTTIEAVIGGRKPLGAEEVNVGALGREVWICTQGSHDRCCGTEGTDLYQRVASRWPGVAVRRVSHMGGHRFAPTAITWPDGRMWGGLNVEALDMIVNRVGDCVDVLPLCRGWWGAPTGPGQVAERAVFGVEGWAWDEVARSVAVVSEADGVTSVRVSADSRTDRIVAVGRGREIQTPTCGELGGQPTKLSLEYEVLDVV